MGLFVRRRGGRRPRLNAESARRQGRRSRRDGAIGPSGAAGLHHHDRSLHLFLCARQNLSEGLAAPGRCGAGASRPRDRQEIRRRQKSAARFGALRRARLDARHDGYRAQSRAQRRDGQRARGQGQRSPFRLGQLPPLYHDVFRCRARHRSSPFRGNPRRSQGSQRLHARHRSQPDDLEDLVARYKARVQEEFGKPFPQDANAQLWGAVGAVFGSWMNQRAITYRRLHNIPESWGTAVNVQAMVFGNMGESSATGVVFTRNPSTGEKKLYGEYLINAQGEDVVAGIRTPQEITEAARKEAGSDKPSMEKALPEAFATLKRIQGTLERHYRDMQDLEFTVEQGKLWMLQTRSGKRTAQAALRIAVELAQEKLIDKTEAVKRIDPATLDQLLHPTIDPKAERNVIATGLPASPGAASGEIVFSSDEAETLKSGGRKVILVRVETSPEDIHGMHAAEGILTTRGGMTSHAAVVARGMGKPCVSGAGSLRVDYRTQTLTAGGTVLKKGDILTID